MHLLDFAQVTVYDFCAMMGFKNGPGFAEFSCSHIWSKQDRMLMQSFLNLARERVEEFLGYPLYPRFVCDERHKWNKQGLIGALRWAYVQKVGTKTVDDIATITPDLTDDVFEFDYTIDFSDTCEARLFHTLLNGGEEIIPLSKSLTGNVLTVRVDKCALVDPAVVIPKGGLDYTVDANFVDEILLKRVYAAQGVGSELVWKPTVNSCASCSPCVEQTQDACPTIRDKRGSTLYVSPATFANDVWTGAALSTFGNCARLPSYVDLDYVAYYDEDCDEGCEQIPASIKLAIIHIALADMPGPPVCGCDLHALLFAEDREIPRMLPENNFFGIKLGHIIAQGMLQPFKIGAGGLLIAV